MCCSLGVVFFLFRLIPTVYLLRCGLVAAAADDIFLFRLIPMVSLVRLDFVLAAADGNVRHHSTSIVFEVGLILLYSVVWRDGVGWVQ